MKWITISLISVLHFVSVTIFAQEAKTDKKVREAVSKLGFIVGKWSGGGWMMGRDGEKHAFKQTENISFKLDSTAILIEGLGKDNNITIHNAMAVVTYDTANKNFNFRSYLSTGQEGLFKGELIGQKFYWYPMDNMRYIIYLNEKGQWYEVGEMKRDNNWFKFFEMTLDRK